ncbi:MAG TPA: flagellar type III secretion system pore protein FliP [Actinomycetota bacterium]|nr:flagellar type III secretion system pore protein FliP [Actinomycetota bacterium]
MSAAARLVAILLGLLILLGPAGPARAQPVDTVEVQVDGVDDPGVRLEVRSGDPTLSRTVLIILLLTVGSVAPAILLLMTAFTRFVVVLALTRNALGLQGIPPTQVLIGLALFMTFFAMGPVLDQVNREALQPALAGRISASQALERGFAPLRSYMLERTDPEDLRMFLGMSGAARLRSQGDVGASALVPAFVLSELRRGFAIGFVIFVPFLVIDLVVSAILTALGMFMVPPAVISLPLKLLLFVLVDGWGLVVRSVMASAGGAG